MAGNGSNIDVEGIRRGRCEKQLCNCHQFSRLVNSVSCMCGHTGLLHTAVAACSGPGNGENCDCTGLKTPPAQFKECLQCGHLVSLHFGDTGVVGGNSILPTVRSEIRILANERRQSDHDRRVQAEESRTIRGGFSRGGYRRGSGRKVSKDKEKNISVTPVLVGVKGKPGLTKIQNGLSRGITIKGDFDLSDFKAACRREFGQSMEIEMNNERDRVFRRMSGTEVFDTATKAELSFTTCYYYNQALDNLEAYDSKRRPEPSLTDDDEYEYMQSGKRKREDEGKGIGEDSLHFGAANYDSRCIGDEDLLNSVVNVASPELSSMGESTQPKPDSLSHDMTNLIETYGITEEMGKLLWDFYDGDIGEIDIWLTKALFNGEDNATAVKDLHGFFAFGVPRRADVQDVDRIYVKLRQYSNNEGPDLRDQIRAIWKNKNDQFNKLADVKFGEGIGEGPRNTYLQAIREYLLTPLFEGTDDHLIVTSAADLLMEKEYFIGGQFMGHIARHGQFVFAGLADVMKDAICGTPADRLYAAMEDVPSYEIQQILQKVMIGDADGLNEYENQELKNLINDSGISTGHIWVTCNQSGYYKVKENDRGYVVGHIAQYIVIIKRALQMTQLIGGFEDVCKFQEFLELCGGQGGKTIAELLTKSYFPILIECSLSKEQVANIIHVEDYEDDTTVRDSLVKSMEVIIEKLDEDQKAPESISKFIQLCTGCANVPLDTVITVKAVDHCDFKVNVCAKTMEVSKDWFKSDETRERFITHVLNEAPWLPSNTFRNRVFRTRVRIAETARRVGKD